MVDVEVTESAAREINLTGGSWHDIFELAASEVERLRGYSVVFVSGGVISGEPNRLSISMERDSND